ncbi:MAG TPA: hypothetical protein VNS63_14450 [Blastocatellia bacterium]|nr:hypothetical protein [Blastocatellia bacterium]
MAISSKYPSLVMIIRHGEKPGDPGNDKEGGPNLSSLGSARAAALPSIFTPDPSATHVHKMHQLDCKLTVGAESQFKGAYGSSGIKAGLSRFQTPNFLFATAPDKGSNRPVETITPLAQALQFSNNPSITINDYNLTNDTAGITFLTSEILKNPDTYAGQVILICWHHGTILQLTTTFGVPSGQLPFTKWPGTVFDLIFSITWDSSGQANLAVDYQQLLYGDKKS